MNVSLRPGARCASYIRVSTKKQETDVQKKTIHEFARKHDLQIVDEYEDVQSAYKKSLLERQNLIRLLHEASQKQFEYILIFDRSRLARNALDHAELRTLFKFSGIPVIMCSTGTSYDNDDKFGDLVKDATTKLEVALTSSRTRGNHESSIKSGVLKGGIAPYGYRYSGKQTLELDPSESVIVLKIFEKYKKGKGFKAIVKDLKDTNYRGKDWGEYHVKAIITNPIYLGKTVMNIRKKNARGTSNDRENWVLGNSDNIPKLIDEKDWEYCYQLYLKRKNGLESPKHYSTSFLLSGLLYCAKCNEPLITKDQRTKGKGEKIYGEQIYYCENTGCNLRVSAEKIHRFVQYNVANKLIVDGLYGSSEKLHDEIKKSYDKEISQIKIQMQSIEAENKKLAGKLYEIEDKVKKMSKNIIRSDNSLDLNKIKVTKMLQNYKQSLTVQMSSNEELLIELEEQKDFIKLVLSDFKVWDEYYRRTSNEEDNHAIGYRRMLLFLIDKIYINKNPGSDIFVDAKADIKIESKINLLTEHYLEILFDEKEIKALTDFYDNEDWFEDDFKDI